MKKYIVYLCVMLVFAATVHSAVACPVLMTATPKVGSAAAGPVTDIRLHFSGEVDPVRSEVTVADAAGRDMGSGKLTGSGTPIDTIIAPVRKLPPGTYKVSWHIYCQCQDNEGSIFPGSYKFIVP